MHSEKKVAKIVEELTMYFFSMGATQMTSSIEKEGATAKIVFQCDFAKENIHKIEKLEETLGKSTDSGMEDIYWELAGQCEPGEGSQLLLLGMMIDDVSVYIEDDFVSIMIEKRGLDL